MFLTTKNRLVKIYKKMPSIVSMPEDKKNARLAKILGDLQMDGIFDEVMQEDDALEEIEMMADIYFNSSISMQDKQKALNSYFNDSRENEVQTQDMVPAVLSSEERIRRKQKEYGIIPDDVHETVIPVVKKLQYGRSPLHDCVAQRCLSEIKMWAAEGKYLFDKDNSGNTPYDMAYFDNYQEAIDILKEAMDRVKKDVA